MTEKERSVCDREHKIFHAQRRERRQRTDFPRIFQSGKLAGKRSGEVRGYPPEPSGALGLRFAPDESG
jgi:hypothetical protein